MFQTIDAIYDGKVFQPIEPVKLKPNSRVRIMIHSTAQPSETETSFLRTARALNLEGPTDWSANIEDYLDDREPG